jgi:ferredoxin
MSGQEEVAAPDSGKTVAVIGSGPAGLAAAYTLRAYGHACRIYEKKSVAGGSLRDFPEEQLPGALLDAEIHRLADMGIAFLFDTEVGTTVSVAQVLEASDAVIVACGLQVTEQAHVFQAAEKKMPVRSIASGKDAAQAAHHYLTGNAGSPAEYNSTMGRIPREQLDAYIIGRAAGKRGLAQASDSETCLSPLSCDAIQSEAARCLHCDCHAPVSCKLRQYATQYGVRPKTFRNAERPLPNGLQRYGNVIFDVGKCIKCGLCIAITKENKEALGMTFTQRGFAMQVSIPFNESLEKALAQSAAECVRACPTGALATETEEERR